jgi:hypothetical protein
MDLTTTATSSNLVTVSKDYLEFLQKHLRECLYVVQANASATRSSPHPPKGANSKKRKRADNSEAKLGSALASFLENSTEPPERAARKLRLAWGVEQDRVEQDSRILCSFTSKSVANSTATSQEEVRPENELVALGIELAQSTESSQTLANVQQTKSNCQLLILLSYCSFLKANGIQENDINRILQKVTTARENNRRRLLLRSTRINELICELVQSGWSLFRATELFFKSMCSILLPVAPN